MSHYFTNEMNLKSDRKEIKHFYKEQSYRFITDNGVFSKSSFDFGSNVLINSIELNDVRSLLDVGCGYGAMGIILSKFYNINVDMIDINDRALGLCRENVELNKADKCKVYNSFLYEKVLSKYDMIVSNPPIRAGKHIVHEVISGAKNFLEDYGSLVIVIQKKQGAPSAMKRMEEIYGNCEVLNKEKGYYILKSINNI